MSVKPIMGVYFEERKKRKSGKFPESRDQTAGHRNIFMEPKISVQPPEQKIIFSYSDM